MTTLFSSLLSLAVAVPQEGVIDNIVVAPAVHRVSGGVVVAAMLAATVLTGRDAMKADAMGTASRVGLVAAQVALMVQALIGIKLLDQGFGVAQLYIHYVGGLIPLGLYMGAGWFAWRDPVRHTRVIAVLSLVGLLSATMAFVIGRAYVTGAV